jgi:RNA polymerase sigma-70 factor, ECF subfamily
MMGESRLDSDEVRLTKRAQKGDREALVTLMTRCERSLYLCALSVVGDSWDAGDAVQDAMVEVLQGIGRLRDASRFRPWLLRIVLNKSYDLLRRQKRVHLVADVAAAGHDEAVHMTTEEDRSVLEAMKGLEADRRVVVALRFFGDLSYAEIADVTDCPIGTVKSRLNRGLEDLRRVLEASHGEY